MPQRAKITAVDALESFRSALINYVSKARPTLEEVSADAMRTRLWLQDEQRVHWEAEFRKRSKLLEQAQSALFSARLSLIGQESAAEQMAVHRAKRMREEAGTKLRLIKKWNRDFDSQVQPLVKQMEKLHTLLANDLVKGVAYLTQTLNTLAAYAEVKPPPEGGAPAPPSGTIAPPVDPAGTTKVGT